VTGSHHQWGPNPTAQSAWADDRLIPTRWKAPLAIAFAGTAAMLTAMAIRFRGRSAGTLDARIAGRVRGDSAATSHLLHLSAGLGSAPALALGSLSLAWICLQWRWRRGVILCLVAPAAATATSEWLLKPLVGRTLNGRLTFPSGAVTAASALVLTLLLLVHSGTGARHLPKQLRLVCSGAGIVAIVAVTYAVVGLGWHYPTDAVGGVATAVTVLIPLGVAIDTLAPRIDGNSGQDARVPVSRTTPTGWPAAATDGSSSTAQPFRQPSGHGYPDP
jgi:hypothetical protein